ncbi:NAD(P)H-binding protein [Acuticoccus sp. M5D2P5]|uniref:NAD(P)H-binding protein n=1 Tax=Acuticoccus kalidii TaxID=2910977 RepID=UPI001F4548CB|nr:NAD(P)H-binding protein [Acuticoccus kalidii]MCF3934026.1 NAD(P)H-binding protein [Acuticoccus kalidii]
MIVVTTPAGNIGRQVLAGLLDAGEPVRVIARDPSRLPQALRARVEIVEGSHSEFDTVARAFEGADAVFWLTPGDPAAPTATAAYVDFSRPACEALRGSGVRHVVAVSALGRDWPHPAGYVTATLDADDMMAATGVAFRALACASLMENILRQLPAIRGGDFYAPTPRDTRLPHVATRDVASVAVRLLRDRSWTGNGSVPLTGPATLSFDEMAAIMSETIARPVRYTPITMEDMRSIMIANGASEGMAEAMVAMLTAKNDGMDAMVPLSPASDTPTDFRQWCADILRPAMG